MKIRQEMKPIRKKRVYRIIADELIEYIAINKLLPDETLPSEMELAGIFNVSRTSIREAIIYLETLGIISVESNNKLTVNDSNLKSVNKSLLFAFKKDDITFRDIIDLRIVIEVGALEMCIKGINEEYLEELSRILENTQVKYNNGEAIHKEDFLFHSCLLSMTGNMIFSKFDIFLKEFFYKKPLVKEEKNVESSFAEHKQIYEYLKNNEVILALKLLKKHLYRLYDKDYAQ